MSSAPTSSIVLSCDRVFRNFQNVINIAIDVGGSLVKIAYSSTLKKPRFASGSSTSENEADIDDKRGPAYEGMRLHFLRFETKHIGECLTFLKENLVGREGQQKVLKATGGGAIKYGKLMASELQMEVEKEDEIECTIKGCNFLLRNIPDEAFTYHHHDEAPFHFHTCDPCGLFPYLLVNIGSGVSIMHVRTADDHQRVGGTSLGGGFFWGLGSILSEAKGFDQLLRLAEQGDHREVDMLVGDIYGSAYEKIGLSADTIASSFGKTVRNSPFTAVPNCNNHFLHVNSEPAVEKKHAAPDMIRSLLLTLSNTIGQIAVLYAQIHSCPRIIFGGFFTRNHPITMRTLSYAVDFWSKGTIKALFLRHEGYLGAIGAFLKGAEADSKQHVDIDTRLFNWSENYAGSSMFKPDIVTSSIPSSFLNQQIGSPAKVSVDTLELDCIQKKLVSLPPEIINIEDYYADLVDLTQDQEARKYWLDCFEESIHKTEKQAIESQPNQPDAVERAKNFTHRYVQHIKLLRQMPFAYGCLNVRGLLDLKEQLLSELYFSDVYAKQKLLENEAAIERFCSLIGEYDQMTDEWRHEALIQGLLAGNVFDWGAGHILSLLQRPQGLGFDEARDNIQKRPWLVDDFDSWKRRMTMKPHECICVFVDNSGFDIVLGVIPFVREMIRRGSKVILAANSEPVLNDVTYRELKSLLSRIRQSCSIIDKALSVGSLVLVENGQASPCIDLRWIDGTLARFMKEMKVELVILEGMGRAIHTNYNAKFRCESLKIAVLKNKWLARRFGGDALSVVFRYEQGCDSLG